MEKAIKDRSDKKAKGYNYVLMDESVLNFGRKWSKTDGITTNSMCVTGEWLTDLNEVTIISLKISKIYKMQKS